MRVEKALGERTSHRPAFVVEVAKYHMHALVFLAQEILDGHFDVVERDVAGSSSSRVRCLDGLGLNAFTSLD